VLLLEREVGKTKRKLFAAFFKAMGEQVVIDKDFCPSDRLLWIGGQEHERAAAR
jgi:hypothetical protein